MMKQLTTWQKAFAYTTLLIVLAWTVFGIHVIWVLLTHDH